MAILKYKDHHSISPITGYQHYNTDCAKIRSALKEIRSLTLHAPGNFQKVQNHGFWNSDFWFKLPFIRIQGHHNEKMKQLVYPPPNIARYW